jgi:hypothetical protein
MIEVVFALILTLNGTMIEHVYKPNLSDCLKSKRIAQNEVNPERVVFSCKKVKAQTEIYMDRKKILIMENTLIVFVLLCMVIYIGLKDNL